MANLKVSIVVRVTENGRRNWVPAIKDHPAGSLYIRYCAGSKARYEKVSDNWDDAEIAKMRMERKLRAASMGLTLPEEVASAKKKLNRISDVITEYIALISKPDKNGEFRPQKSINSTKSELERFHVWSKKTYVEELSRGLLEKWRDELLPEYEKDTIYNKLMTVTTWLKNNPVVPTPPLLPISAFPDKKVTIPDPYTEDEYNAMMEKANYEEGLLVYFFATTGMREQEIAHAEREDIDWELGELHIVKKPKYGWGGKTKAALRQVPLEDGLLAEFRLRGAGLLFPNVYGQPEAHYLRIIERLATAAGVTPTTTKPHMKAAGMVKNDWCHRFRDTALTNKIHFTKAESMAALLQLCKQIGHKGTGTLDKYFGKLKKPYHPRLRLKRASEKVVAIA